MAEEKLTGGGLSLDAQLRGTAVTYSGQEREMIGTVRDITTQVGTGRFRSFKTVTDIGEIRCLIAYGSDPLQLDPRIWPVVWQWTESVIVNPVEPTDAQDDKKDDEEE
jgi:hypothetical protein